MKASTLSPAELFGNHVRFVIPLFQRPYVWTKLDQWDPLWRDVTQVAEDLMTAPTGYGSPAVSPHFLGAVVIDQPSTPTGYIGVRNVVDGQQRLTTLQLLLHAAFRVATEHGQGLDAQALAVLVTNSSAIAQHPYELFKVWPTTRDQDAFTIAMGNESAGQAEHSPIVEADRFFTAEILEWALEPGGDPKARLSALVKTLRDYLKLVVIDLEPGDNPQVIFETLNHRGAPLLAADLIKNLIFQEAVRQGRDLELLYTRYWSDLDTEYWRQRIQRGTLLVPRIDIFVNYWLIMRLLSEVPSDRIYADFRDKLIPKINDIEELLAELSRDAKTYASMDSLPPESAHGQFQYRVLQAMNSAVVTPFLLWILKWNDSELPESQRDKALRSLESWIVRRGLCRLSTKEISRLILDLLREVAANGPLFVGDTTYDFLIKQQTDTRMWPSDSMVVEAVRTTPMYRALVRGRLRMVIEALEDNRRTAKSETSRCPRNLTVEHIMPQGWRQYWSDGTLSEAQEVRRDFLVQTLGNLTLVNERLNPALSNRPWTDEQAFKSGLDGAGKRVEIMKHSTLKLNADLVMENLRSWTEPAIQVRTVELSKILIEIWPGPVGPDPVNLADALSESSVPLLTDEPGGEPGQRKYQPLIDWLRTQSVDVLVASFDDIEEILGATLPSSARKYPTYWHSASNVLGAAVQEAGYKSSAVNVSAETVKFTRILALSESEQIFAE